MLRIACFLSGKPPAEYFVIHMDENKTVDDLKRIIWDDRRFPMDPSFLPRDINLWSVDSQAQGLLEGKQPVDVAAFEKSLLEGGKTFKEYTRDVGANSKWSFKILVERAAKTDGAPRPSTAPSAASSTAPSATSSTAHSPVISTTPSPLGTRKIARMRPSPSLRNANDQIPIQQALAEMQIKGAKEFEITPKSPKTLHAKDASSAGTKDDVPDKLEKPSVKEGPSQQASKLNNALDKLGKPSVKEGPSQQASKLKDAPGKLEKPSVKEGPSQQASKLKDAPGKLEKPSVKEGPSQPTSKLNDAQIKVPRQLGTEDLCKIRMGQAATDDKQEKIQDQTAKKGEDEEQLYHKSIFNKEIKALSRKHEESLAELRKELEELRRLCNRVEFNVVVVPRNKDEGFLWGTTIEKTTMDELENAIYRRHPERKDKDQGTALLMVMHSTDETYPLTPSAQKGKELRGSELIRNDVHLRNILQQYQKAGNKTLTLLMETPNRLFTSFTFEHVVNLFQLTNLDDPIISDILCMVDFIATVHDRNLQEESKRQLVDELDARIECMPIADMGQNVRDFVAPFLFQAGRVFKGELRLKSQRPIAGRYGQGTMDFVIEPSLKDNSGTSQTEGQLTHVFGVITLVRNGDFSQAMAQNLLQLDASLRWRTICLSTKAKMAYGIVTDAVDWYFVECSISPQDPLRPKFRVTALGFNRIRYNDRGDWKLDSGYILDLVVTLFGRIQTEIQEQGGQLGLERPLLRSIH